jgi:K+-transporting ATPase A subunit
MTDRQPVIDEWKQICENNDKVFSVFTDEILQEFHAWCMEQSAENQTFSFWDNFLYVDFMSYLGLYFSIRSRNWLHLKPQKTYLSLPEIEAEKQPLDKC